MPEHLQSQISALHQGIDAFEPYIYDLHSTFKNGEFSDWPTVILTTTIQTTAMSLFKLFPPSAKSNEPLDLRSIATIIRNVVDTHDALNLLANADTPEEFNLHRDILGLYLSDRINKVQVRIMSEKAEELYKRTKSFYWGNIRNSILYDKSMDRLKSGNAIFYKSRQQRVQETCGKHCDFILGVLTDLSTYVHSIPPSIWMGSIENLFSNSPSNRDGVAVWLRVSNFYFAQCIRIILKTLGKAPTAEMALFLDNYKHVFSE